MLEIITSTDWFVVSSLFLVAFFVMALQLDLSVATFMSGHALGRQTSQRRLRLMVDQFALGFVIMTWLVISTTCLVLHFSLHDLIKTSWFWTIISGVILGQGLLMTLLDFSKKTSPHPWLNQVMRQFLTKRASKTRSPAEAFSLGLTSFLTQTPIVLLTFIVAGATLLVLPGQFLVPGTIIFSLTLGVPLLMFRGYLRNNQSGVGVQQFIVKNRRFFQIVRLICLLVLVLIITSELSHLGVKNG